MVRKLLVLGSVMAIGAVGVATLLPSAGAADNGARWIRVKSVAVEEQFVDVPPANESLGDQIVFSSRLRRSGKRVGDVSVVCTITALRTETVQCVATASFASWFHGGGQITVQGLLFGEPERFTLPITGGSGAFVGAEGQVHVRQVNPTLEILTFELLA
jgi:Allene oxide cyclase